MCVLSAGRICIFLRAVFVARLWSAASHDRKRTCLFGALFVRTMCNILSGILFSGQPFF